MNKWIKFVCLGLIGLLLAGCSSSQPGQPQKELDTGFIPARVGMYDSEDTALIKKIDKQGKTIVFYNLVRQKNYTLYFDGTTSLYDKYGSALTMDQIKPGDIANIRFLKGKKALAYLQKSDEVFVLEDVTNFTINEKKQKMLIGDQTYHLEDNLFVYSGGEQVEIMDINQVDTLRVQGIGHTIYSVYIDKGHGYLRLKNDEYFWGGWIEVGNSVIQKIKEDMLLVVPEGKYDILFTNNGMSGSKRVTIHRDKETELDIGDIKKEEDKKQYGNLIFVVSPEEATVFIDGKEIDISLPVKVEYGIHQLMAKAEGYQTVLQYIKVGQENATIQIELEEDDGDSVSSNIINSSNESDTVSTTGGKITIDAPAGVEVYMDGTYIGMAPCSFKKTAGVHVITLRKDGYVTKSYTINITNVETNENMSFSALIKEEQKNKDNEKEEASNSSGEKDESPSSSEDSNSDKSTEEEEGTKVVEDEFPG